MKMYRINLNGFCFNEIILKVITADNLVELNNDGWLDCWLDKYTPNINWSGIKSVEIEKDNVEKSESDLKIKKITRKIGCRNKDNRIKPGESKIIN